MEEWLGGLSGDSAELCCIRWPAMVERSDG